MDLQTKKKRLKKIIRRIEEVMENDEYVNYMISQDDIKILEIVLNYKPYTKLPQEDKVKKKILGRGLKNGKKYKSSNSK